MATENEDLVLSISADTRQIMNAMKKLTGEIAKSTSGVQKQFDSLGRGVDKAMSTAMQKRIDSMVGIGTNATKEWTGALAQQGQEMERLRARFNPVFSTVNRYKSTINEIRAAHRLGAISSDEMTAAIQRERQAALASISAIKQRNAALSDSPVVGGGNSFNTANIAAQFQDIGVTTAMGMNPLQIALQQGTQLSAVLNQMGDSKQVIAGLGSAFMSIVNPVSLVTIGLIAAAAAATQYFFTADEGSEASSQSLKKQADLIQQVAQKWGEALPALKAFADEQQRLADNADKTRAGQILMARAFDQIGMILPRLNAELSKFTHEASGGGWGGAAEDQANRLASAYDEVETAFAEYTDAVNSNRDSTQQFERLQQALTAFIANSAVPATGSLRDVVLELGDAYSAAAEKAAEAKVQFAQAASAEAAAAANRSRFSRTTGRLTPSTGASLGDAEFAGRFGFSDYFNFPSERKERAGGKSKEVTEAERAKKAIDDVVASLRFEQEQLGRTGTQQRIYNELKRAGVDINSESGRQIASLVTSLEAERQAMEANKKALEDRGQAIENLFDMGADAIGSIIDKSVTAEDALKKLVIQLALAAAQAALFNSGPLAGLFGGGFGGGFKANTTAGAFFGAGGLPQFATGTANTGGSRGQPIGIVHGQEAVIPLPNGGKVPVQIQAPVAPTFSQSGHASAPAPSAAVYHIDARGAQQGVGKEIRDALEAYDKGRQARLAADLPKLRTWGMA